MICPSLLQIGVKYKLANSAQLRAKSPRDLEQTVFQVSWFRHITTVIILSSFGVVTRHCILPRRSNPQYFGYSHILGRLASCLLWQGSPQSRSQTVCVLSGMGGVGKSETILQFLDKNAALRERCDILSLSRWCHAGIVANYRSDTGPFFG